MDPFENESLSIVDNCSGPVGSILYQNSIQYYSQAYLAPLIAIIGICSNLLNFFVMFDRRIARIPSFTYLQALSLFDGIFLLLAAWEVAAPTMGSVSVSPAFNQFYVSTILYCRMLNTACLGTSLLVVIAFNFDRYISVCQPLQVDTFRRSPFGRPLVITVICFCISMLISARYIISFHVNTCLHYDNHENSVSYSFIQKRPGKMTELYFKSADFMSMVIFNIMPWVLLFIINFRIIVGLRNVAQREEEEQEEDVGGGKHGQSYRSTLTISVTCKNAVTPRSQAPRSPLGRQQWNINAMLCAVVVTLFSCTAPQVLARLLVHTLGYNNSFALTYVAVSQLFLFINASANLCLYCLVSPRYRRILKSRLRRFKRSLRRGCFTVCCCVCGHKHGRHSSFTTGKRCNVRVRLRTNPELREKQRILKEEHIKKHPVFPVSVV